MPSRIILDRPTLATHHPTVFRLMSFALASCLILSACKSREQANVRDQPDKDIQRHALIIAPLIDPAKLDTLAGKRAATPRLRKACYWLEMARKEGLDPRHVITQAHNHTSPMSKARTEAQNDSLLRNRMILERLGCLDDAGMGKLRRGRAPTITRGPYAGELATVDHIIPRSVCPELDNRIYNLEFMPDTLNTRKRMRPSSATQVNYDAEALTGKPRLV